jgi:hypothetical protein
MIAGTIVDSRDIRDLSSTDSRFLSLQPLQSFFFFLNNYQVESCNLRNPIRPKRTKSQIAAL